MIEEIYVSKDGDDSASGSRKNPLKTIEAAKNTAVEMLNKKKQEVSVIVGSGIYYINEPMVFNSSDLDMSESSLKFLAASGESPTISGGFRIDSEWSEWKDGIWICDVSSEVDNFLELSQLFINGKRQTLSRFPKEGYCYPDDVELTWPHKFLYFKKEDFSNKSWKHPEEMILHIFAKTKWGNLQWKIKDIDWDSRRIQLGRGGFQINDIIQGEDGTGIDGRSAYFIENVFDELSRPGEWYFDRETGTLYAIPEEGIDLNEALVEAPRLTQLVEFRGRQNQTISHIEFTGFRFAHSKATFLEEYEAPSLGDWTIFRGGALYFEGAEDCAIRDCFFDAPGGNAVFINHYNRRITVAHNRITQCGDSAICVVGSKQHSIGSNHKYPAKIKISNNVIHDIGIFGKQTAGVFISVSRDNLVSHNHIYNTPRSAICLNDGTWGGHIIEYNDIHNTVQETGDHGPFNSWGRERFWCLQQSHGPLSHGAGDVKLDCRKTVIIRNNRFEDYKGWGIDLDDGSSNFHVYNNLCIGISIKLREGDYRLIENNIFINGANPPGFHIGYENNHDRFIRNIIVMNSAFDNPEVDINFNKGKSEGKIYEIIGHPLKGPLMEEINHNLFYNDRGCFMAAIHFRPLGSLQKDYSLEDWQKLGYDKDSLYADPGFVNFDKGDYRLNVDSPAFKLGFTEFELASIGVRNSEQE